MNDNNNTAAAAESPSSLIKSPPSSPSATTAAAAAEHERQTLLLMLLAQVCSLHDATPRTFVVHVLALFERGILDSNSIRFLFDMGLVPWRYNEQFTGCFDDNNDGSAAGNTKRDNDDGECDNNCYESEIATPQNNTATPVVSAIVPYAANNLNHKHPWMRHIPPAPPLHHNSQQSKMNMSIRQSQASAIRRHLAHQESIDSSSAHSSVFGSASAGIIPGITSPSIATTSTSSTANHNGAWKRTTSSATAMPSKHSSLLSVDESFYNPSQHKNNNNSDNRTTNVDNEEEDQQQQESHHHDQQHNNNNNTQLATTNVPINTSSWSAEHHPLSLSIHPNSSHPGTTPLQSPK